jgi:GAF domain
LAKEQPPTAPAEPPSEQDKESHRARNLLRFTSSRRPETPEQEVPTRPTAATGAEYDRLSKSIQSVQQTLGGQSAEFYERELPQIAASEIAKRVRADVIVLLLDNGQGLMEVSGEVGLNPAERQLSVEYGRDVMRELFRAGIGLIEDTNRVRSALAEIPGTNADTLIMVPLVHERLGFGVLMAGRDRRKSGGQFTDADVEALMGFADGIASSLRTVVLLRHLKGQLSALKGQ